MCRQFKSGKSCQRMETQFSAREMRSALEFFLSNVKHPNAGKEPDGKSKTHISILMVGTTEIQCISNKIFKKSWMGQRNHINIYLKLNIFPRLFTSTVSLLFGKNTTYPLNKIKTENISFSAFTQILCFPTFTWQYKNPIQTRNYYVHVPQCSSYISNIVSICIFQCLRSHSSRVFGFKIP